MHVRLRIAPQYPYRGDIRDQTRFNIANIALNNITKIKLQNCKRDKR
jgi:hypothetical protein